jgi:TonB family protein
MHKLHLLRVSYVATLIVLGYAAPALAQSSSPSSNASTASSQGSWQAPPAGSNGVSKPSCSYTPRPPATKEAKTAKYHGTLVLLGIVELDGTVTHIRVPRAVGFGLDESAIDTLKKWKCKAANGPDGKPVRSDVSFRFDFDFR